ncbi:MAG: 3'-5' exoribonuclease YhaM family protein [Gemmataceae bacterium]
MAVAPPVVPLHQMSVRQLADTFAQLAEKNLHKTRDGKPFFNLKWKNRYRTVSMVIWADAEQYRVCESDWHVGGFYKLRGVYQEHEKYGPQLDVVQVRDVLPTDAEAGFRETDFYDRSRREPVELFTELFEFVGLHLKHPPLLQLVQGLLATHRETLLRLPATAKHFYPYPGGWLSHVLNVARTAQWLAIYYQNEHATLRPPLNVELILAGAVLHDIGRVQELTVGPPGHLAEPTLRGRLQGHITLARDMVRAATAELPELSEEWQLLLDHLILSHLSLPEWGSPRLPMIPEVLILHHADDLDAKLEMYARVLENDHHDGPWTDRDPILGKPLWKARSV